MKRTCLAFTLATSAFAANAGGYMINANSLGKATLTGTYGRKK